MNYREFFAMFKKLQGSYPMEREEFLQELTGKSSLKELSGTEYATVIKEMRERVFRLGLNTAQEAYEKANRSRKRIIANFHCMNYDNAVQSAKKWAENQTKMNFNKIPQKRLSKLVAVSDKMVREYEADLRKHTS